MVAIVDYGVGNLFSLTSSFAAIGEEAIATGEPEKLLKADRLILPGVGAFGDAAKALRDSGLADVVIEAAKKGTPLLGICLGMQLLFDESYEYGVHPGLGLISGQVRAISEHIPRELKIPHIGWNALHFTGEPCPIFRHTREGAYVYFVHSYAAVGCEESTAAVTDYGASLTAAVWKDNVYGTQFHPEKSGKVGLDMLRAFCGKEAGAC
jgi:glutamine amidotransferase